MPEAMPMPKREPPPSSFETADTMTPEQLQRELYGEQTEEEAPETLRSPGVQPPGEEAAEPLLGGFPVESGVYSKREGEGYSITVKGTENVAGDRNAPPFVPATEEPSEEEKAA